MSKYQLTVAIPTYDRPQQLQQTLSVILPQVLAHPEVQLLVLDNCSPVPAIGVLEEVSKGNPLTERVRVIRHCANIGGNANILRCFELADGEWLWCLGDDDTPADNAVDQILSDIKTTDSCYVYYRLAHNVPMLSDCPDGRFVSGDIGEWVRRVPRYGARLFISEAIFKLANMRPYFLQAYVCMSSGAPHLVMSFLAVSDGGKFMLSDNQIAKYNCPDGGVAYNCAPLAYGSATLISIANTEKRAIDFDLFFSESFATWISPQFLLLQVINLHNSLSSDVIARRFRIISSQFKPKFLANPKGWCAWEGCQFLSHFPRTFMSLARLKARLRGRKYQSGDLARCG